MGCGMISSNFVRMRRMAQKRLTAVGRVAASTSQMWSKSRFSAAWFATCESRTPRATPMAAATPIAGAPRTIRGYCLKCALIPIMLCCLIALGVGLKFGCHNSILIFLQPHRLRTAVYQSVIRVPFLPENIDIHRSPEDVDCGFRCAEHGQEAWRDTTTPHRWHYLVPSRWQCRFAHLEPFGG